MRLGLGVSIFGHVAALGFGFFAFPEARPFAPEMIEALPVELVDVAEVTDLLTGDKTSELLPAEKPQPKPEVKADSPAPKPVDKPAEKPVEAARQPVAPPPPLPESPPEPEPEPDEIAALADPIEPEPPPPAEAPEPPPAEEPALEPQPPKPVESRLPKARPAPPKQVARAEAQPKPEEQDRLRELTQTPEPEPEFDPEDITALLNKQEPAGGGDPNPVDAPQTLGSIDGKADAAMTQNWIAALTAKLIGCWNPPIGARDAGALVVTVGFSLLPDGSLAGTPVPVQVTGVSNPQAVAATDAAVRAVAQCAPYNDIFPPEHYDQWQSILIDFDPRKMLGAG